MAAFDRWQNESGRSVIRDGQIKREELTRPPEFHNLVHAGHEAARVGGARIELIRDRDVTALGTCYQQIPLRLMPPFPIDDEPASLLYLINLTAGLLDGDGHLLEVRARSGTHAVITGQSATRVHPAVTSFATQQWAVEVEDDACLVVLPGPTIPYTGSRYYQRGRVNLGQRARLIWGDIWLAGRYERGELSERFVFERIVQDFEARREGRLIFRDRFCWDGPWSPDDVQWYFGGSLASASLFIAGPPAPVPPLRNDLFVRSTFTLDTGETCLRWCGQPAAVTTDLVKVALEVASSWSSEPGKPPWLLSSSSLAPNHWFTRWNQT